MIKRSMIIGSLPIDKILIKSNTGLNLEHSGRFVSTINGMQLKLSCNGASSSAIALSVGIGLVK